MMRMPSGERSRVAGRGAKVGVATAGDVACGDDNCSFQSRITNASVSGANLLWIIVDGFGMTSEGAYTLGYTLN